MENGLFVDDVDDLGVDDEVKVSDGEVDVGNFSLGKHFPGAFGEKHWTQSLASPSLNTCHQRMHLARWRGNATKRLWCLLVIHFTLFSSITLRISGRGPILIHT